MTRSAKVEVALLAILAAPCAALFAAATAAPDDQKLVQAQMVLTVSEGKRLIARAVAQMPIVKKALKDGIVIICKGTTTTYVAEEILSTRIPHGAFVLGRTYPAVGGKKLRDVPNIGEVILVKGKHRKDLSLQQAVRMLKAGDVVIKGANALDYPNRLAAGIVGSSSGGTTGKILPYVHSRKAHLLIPVGLEKQVSGSVTDIVRKMQQPVESLNDVPSMYLFTGHIVTEIEALELLAGVSACQVAAGGIGGAEGSVRLLCRGPREKVEKALELAKQVQGEPPFVE